jgi:UDP-glucose 4-epimerase
MKIMITGDKGFVGAETRRYIESMYTSLYEGKNRTITSFTDPMPTHEVIGYDIMDGYDIRDAQQLDEFVKQHKPDRILHLAAIARFSDADKNPQLAFETNVMGTRNIALVANKHHIPVVYSSTGSVYMPITDFTGSIKEDWTAKGNSVYGCTKYAGETYISELNPHIILRYAHLYGKEKRMHGLIGGFVERIERGLAPTLFGGKQSNDFTYIKDVARANYLALVSPWDKWNQIYNIGTGEEITAEDAGKTICEAFNYKGKIEVKDGRTVDPERFLFDCSKAERMLGFKYEYNFEAGLKDMFHDTSNS